MNVVGATIEFKREHPHNYWIRILCFAFSMVFLALWMVDDVEATDEDSFQASAGWPYANYQYSGSYDYLHTKGDYIVVPHTTSNGDLEVAYKKETSDTWNHTSLALYDWNGYTGPWYVYGAVGTSNGSVCVMAVNYNGATYADVVWLWTKFLGDDWDTWDEEQIIASTVHYNKGGIAINDTDIIMLGCARGSSSPYTLYYETFDFQAYSLGHAVAAGHSYGTTIKNYVSTQANLSGSFHVTYQANDNYYYYRDLDKTFLQVQIATNTYNIKDAAFLNNDMLVCAGGTGTSYVDYWYQSDYESAFTRIRLTTTMNGWSYGASLSLLANSNATRVLAWNGDYLYIWASTWNGTEVSWQNSEVETDVYNINYDRACGNNRQRWPQDPDGRQWAMPTAGWSLVVWHENGAVDFHKLLWNGTEFWGDLTTSPPNITTTALDPATYGTYYTYTLTGVNGTSPLSWSLLVGPGWMTLGASNGTLYGTPDGTGEETVTVRLSDAIPRTDDRSWTLTINQASEGSSDDPLTASGLWYSSEDCRSWSITLVVILVALAVLGLMGDRL